MYGMMIVEDERLEREGLMEFLDWEKLGIRLVGVACDGLEGLEMAERLKPDIVMADIRMPGMGGLQMARLLREKRSDIRIIIVTGYDDFNYAREAIHAQVTGYLLKPIEEAETEEVIRKAIAELDREKRLVKRIAAGEEAIRRISSGTDGDEESEDVLAGNAEDVPGSVMEAGLQEAVRRAREIVETRYGQDINLKSVAAEVGLTPNYLGTLFRRQLGKSFNDYLLNIRMEKAARMLRSPHERVGQVAATVGYSNTSYFCVVFRQTYGISPGEYQERANRG